MGWSEVTPAVVKCALLPTVALFLSTLAWSQQSDGTQPADLATSVHELRQQIEELRTAVKDLRAEAARYHAETLELRQQLEEPRED